MKILSSTIKKPATFFIFFIFYQVVFAVNNGNIFKTEKAVLSKDYLYLATVNSNTSLNVRDSPDLKGNKVGNIKTGKEVKVLKHTDIYLTLELKNRTAYGQWVYISYKDVYNSLKQGYVYDYFLDMSVDMKKLGYSIPEAIEKFKKNKDCIVENTTDEFMFSMQGLSYSKEENGRVERVRIEIQGLKEKNSVFQRIDFQPSLWFSYNEVPCIATNFYEISKNDSPLEIGSFGYLVIWDYNIDGLQDFALMTDVGGNAGSWYVFYLQQKDGSFKKEEDYPFQNSLFPVDIDHEQKIITETHPHGCCKLSTTIYKKEKKGWKLIKSVVEDM